ncbi:hypothetical protein MRBLMS1_004560 [Massilia sp. LMS1-1-1.1]
MAPPLSPLSNVKMLQMAWGITGGWRAAWKSSDFKISLFVTFLCFNFWLTLPWWDQVISVLPNLLGFTLGGFAIFLGFGSESFKTMLSDVDEKRSPYISVSASFLIFVFFQVLALLYALAAKSLHFDLMQSAKYIKTNFQYFKEFDFLKVIQPLQLWLDRFDVLASGVGYFLFVYSLIFSLRASMRIFRLSRWYHQLIVAEAAEAEAARLRLNPPP